MSRSVECCLPLILCFCCLFVGLWAQPRQYWSLDECHHGWEQSTAHERFLTRYAHWEGWELYASSSYTLRKVRKKWLLTCIELFLGLDLWIGHESIDQICIQIGFSFHVHVYVSAGVAWGIGCSWAELAGWGRYQHAIGLVLEVWVDTFAVGVDSLWEIYIAVSVGYGSSAAMIASWSWTVWSVYLWVA